MQKIDKKQRIMLAAENLFTSRRFHEIRMEDVARKACVGKGTIYQYFENKDDLFFQTATSGFEELYELVQQNIPQTAGFREKLTVTCSHIVAFVEKRRQLFQMMNDGSIRLHLTGASRERLSNNRRLLRAVIAGIMQRGIEEGEIRSDMKPEVLSVFLMGMLRSRAWDMEGVDKNDCSLDVVIDLICNGALKRNDVEQPKMELPV
jgi:AcrR family transcriptional regulator